MLLPLADEQHGAAQQAHSHHEEVMNDKKRKRHHHEKRRVIPTFAPGVDSDERAQWIARKMTQLERMLQDMEDIAGDLNVNCFVRDDLQGGAVYTISPSGLSSDVARAMESNYRLGDLFDLEVVKQAKKRRMIHQERLNVVIGNDDVANDDDEFSSNDAFPHLEQLRFLVQRMMDVIIANPPMGRDSNGILTSYDDPNHCHHDTLSSKASSPIQCDGHRIILNAVRAAWYPEDVPLEEPSGLPREHLERIVKEALRKGAITAQKLADIAQRELGFDIRASMRCLELFESFEGPGGNHNASAGSAAGAPPSVAHPPSGA